ncbi:hypothetical protein DND67_30640, partial [Pseudomonas syringae pv. pisi]
GLIMQKCLLCVTAAMCLSRFPLNASITTNMQCFWSISVKKVVKLSTLVKKFIRKTWYVLVAAFVEICRWSMSQLRAMIILLIFQRSMLKSLDVTTVRLLLKKLLGRVLVCRTWSNT